MLTTEAVQHLKHSCTPKEFEQYANGNKTFDIKLNDGVFSLQEGDFITFEERDPNTGKLTGRTETKRVGTVLDTTTITNLDNKEVAERGISIFSLQQEDFQRLGR